MGRDDHLAALRAACERARAGAAAVVVLAGEAGSGKTRLLAELAAEVRDCRGDRARRALHRRRRRAVRALHRGAAPVRRGQLGNASRVGDRRARTTAAGARRRGPAHRGAMPWPPVTVCSRRWPRRSGTPPAAARCCSSSRTCTGRTSRRCRCSAHVVRSAGWAPLLVVASLRDEGGGLLGDLQRERALERVVLGGLSEGEAAELAAAWLGSAPPPDLAAAVHRRSGGNPLFVEELARHLAESYPGRPADALVAAAGREVPHGVRAVIDRRLARLGEDAGEAVRLAAVAGEDFALADVAAACGQRDELVAAHLDVAVGAGLIDEGARAGRYRFAHALIREAVIAGMTATRRALLHRRMGEALQALPERRSRAPDGRARAPPPGRPPAGGRRDGGGGRARRRPARDAGAGLRGGRRPARARPRRRPRRARSGARGGPARARRRPAALGRRAGGRRPLPRGGRGRPHARRRRPAGARRARERRPRA